MAEIRKHLQREIREIVELLDFDEDIMASGFYHLSPKHKHAVNRALHVLCEKNVIYEYSTKPQERGGNPTIVYRRVKTAQQAEEFTFHKVPEGWLSELYKKPIPISANVPIREVRFNIDFDPMEI